MTTEFDYETFLANLPACYPTVRDDAQIYTTVLDLYDGIPCLRTEGRGFEYFSFPGLINVETNRDADAPDDFVAWWWPDSIRQPRSEILISVGWGHHIPRPLKYTPCGCMACGEEVQPGHFACSSSTHIERAIERAGFARRVYADGSWRWVATDSGSVACGMSVSLHADCTCSVTHVVVSVPSNPYPDTSDKSGKFEINAYIVCQYHAQKINPASFCREILNLTA